MLFSLGDSTNVLGPDENFGLVPVSVEFGPVSVDMAGTRPVPRFFSERVFKVAKRTVESRYSLKSENFMKYNLSFLKFRY